MTPKLILLKYNKINNYNIMLSHINFTEIFIETHNEYIQMHKKHISVNKRHTLQTRYLELHNFISNSVYWTRYNIDIDTKKYKKNCITGKYLNEIHLFYVKYDFYKILYTKLLTIYLKLTNFETLKNVSIDSFFCRNILGSNLNRNPHYSNKTGLKNHAMIDSNRVPISMFISNGTVSDSITINDLFENLYIDNEILKEHTDTIITDSSYSSIINIYDLTNRGFNVIMGRNKHHIKKNTITENASEELVHTYKTRGTSENFFSNIQRYPCLLNNYERTIQSYEGLSIFAACCILAKKINKIINELNNVSLKKKRNEDNLKKKKQSEELKQKRYHEKKDRQKIKKEEDDERKKKAIEIKKKINEKISKGIKKRIIKRSYNKYIGNKNQQSKKFSYDTFQKYIDNGMCKYIANYELMSTYKYKFRKKDLYIITSKQKAFIDDNIKELMNTVDQKEKIDKFSRSFFRIDD